MESVDALLRGGWTPDPADRVEVVAVHGPACPVREGHGCLCTPRLLLRALPRRRDPLHDDGLDFGERGLPAAG